MHHYSSFRSIVWCYSSLDYTFINRSSVLLTWTAPYTLDKVPITGYYILNGLVNIITTNNNTNITLSATNPDPCILNKISVSPINDAGTGSSNYITFYFETGYHYYMVSLSSQYIFQFLLLLPMYMYQL